MTKKRLSWQEEFSKRLLRVETAVYILAGKAGIELGTPIFNFVTALMKGSP